MKNSENTLAPVNLSKVIRLSHGLLMTMRLLKSRCSSDHTSTGELLAMQRFFREFEGWIKETDRWKNEQAGLRETLRRRHKKQAAIVKPWRSRI